MASPFLGIAAGLAQGFPQGIQIGSDLAYRQQSMEIQKQQADASNITAFSNAMKLPDPATRQLAMSRTFKGATGLDPESDLGKQALTAINKSTDETRAQLSAALPGTSPAVINYMMSDPALMTETLLRISQQKNIMSVLGNLPTPENPSGTGDMGTGTAGAGGTVVAPVADAGTSAVSTQPVVPPAPASAIPFNAPATAPLASSAATGTTAPPTTTAPTASPPPKPGVASQPGTGPGQTLPKVAVGKGPNGQVISWDPNTDPYIVNMQKAILYTSTMPGVTPEIMSALNSRLTQYIDGQKFKFTQFIDIQNLGLHSKEVAISGYHAALDREHLTMEEQAQEYHQTKEPLSELGKQQADVARGNLPPAGVTGGGVSSTVGNTDTRQLPATIAATPSTETQLPANVKIDLTNAQNNKDGSFTITDAATLKAAGITDPTIRLVIDAPTGKAYIQTPTSTSLRTAANLDEAQVALNLTQRGYNFVDSISKSVIANPQSYGAYGSTKAVVQDWVGIAKDVAAEFPDAKSLLAATGLSRLPFNPIAPTLDGISQFMKAYVTKTLTMAGGAAGLSAYGVTDKSVQDLTDVGAGSSTTVAAHLEQIKNLLAQAKVDLQSRLPSGGTSGVPDTTGGTQPAAQPTQQNQTQPEDKAAEQLKSDYDAWQKKPVEEQKKLYGTIYDMRPSRYDADPSAASHLSKIPMGQIFRLQDLLKQYKEPANQKVMKDYFNYLFGKTATAEIGY